jgi:hypothetical protein
MAEIDEPRIIPTEDFPFQVFLKQIADQITDEELQTLKFFLSGCFYDFSIAFLELFRIPWYFFFQIEQYIK